MQSDDWVRKQMKKAYEGHEVVYRRMKRAGVKVWGDKGSGSVGKSGTRETYGFLRDVLSQPWAPKKGRVIELGCGTGPILQWLCKRGFSGVGVDVSRTAISMAREQSDGLDIQFLHRDVCNLNTRGLGKFDIAIDGLCLHCLTEREDRRAYLDNVCKMLKDGGLFVLLSMCGPMDKKRFGKAFREQKLLKKIVYVPFEDKRYGRLVKLDGKYYLPTRYIGHWKEILGEVQRAGFALKLTRYKANDRTDFCGTLSIGALRQ